MARQKNDGKGRIGGRTKGTPNRVTISLRKFVENLIDDNRGQIKKDLKSLKPKERLVLLEKLMQYVLPKTQNVSAEVNINQLNDESLQSLATNLLEKIQDENND